MMGLRGKCAHLRFYGSSPWNRPFLLPLNFRCFQELPSGSQSRRGATPDPHGRVPGAIATNHTPFFTGISAELHTDTLYDIAESVSGRIDLACHQTRRDNHVPFVLIPLFFVVAPQEVIQRKRESCRERLGPCDFCNVPTCTPQLGHLLNGVFQAANSLNYFGSVNVDQNLMTRAVDFLLSLENEFGEFFQQSFTLAPQGLKLSRFGEILDAKCCKVLLTGCGQTF